MTTIANIVPPDASTIDKDTPIVFDAQGLAPFLVVWVKLAAEPDALVAYDGDAFVAPFLASTITDLGGGDFQFSILQEGGWSSAIEGLTIEPTA